MKKRHMMLLAIVVLLGYSLIEPYLLRVSEVTVSDRRVPGGFDGKRIAFISDIHCGVFLSTDRVGKVVKLANAQQPDLILLGGDYVISGEGTIGPCIDELKGLKAPLGVFAVLGNHDNWAGAQATREALAAAGITVLENDATWVGSGGGRIRVGGVGDMWTDSQDLNPTFENTTGDDYIILLSHNPQYVDTMTTDRVGLVLSGHTHGGQILPVRLLAPYLPSRLRQRYVSGMYKTDRTSVYVTNGIGMVFFPVRFMARPEIALITLRKI